MRRSTEISALRTREKSAWKVIDQHLRMDLVDERGRPLIPSKVRQAAAEFVLKRLYPEKLEFLGNGVTANITINVTRIEKKEEDGDYLQASRQSIIGIQ